MVWNVRESPQLAVNCLIRIDLRPPTESSPWGRTVRVTNLKNLHSTVVRINDRGPGIEGRLIDVSWAAAKKLGFVGAGLTLVEVNIVTYPQTSPRQVTSSESPKLN